MLICLGWKTQKEISGGFLFLRYEFKILETKFYVEIKKLSHLKQYHCLLNFFNLVS
jgi:hypothetical protein